MVAAQEGVGARAVHGRAAATGVVLVLGNCTVDVSFAVQRFPKPGETLLAASRRVDLGGKGANQALVAHRSGVATTLAAPVGTDADGDWAVARLVAEGLPGPALTRVPTATDQSILYIAPDGENCIVSSHDAAASATPAWAEAVVEAATAGRATVGTAAAGMVVLVQGNLPHDATAAALAAARRRGLTTVVNPAPIQYSWASLLPMADVVVANTVECAELGGSDDVAAAGAAIRAGGAGTVIVTLGAGGALAVRESGTLSVPAPRVAAVDTVGAGDVFCGSLAAGLARAVPLATAMAVAVDAAALAVTRPGTQASFPTAAEMAAILARHGVR